MSPTNRNISDKFPDIPLELEQVVGFFRRVGCTQLWVKRLAQNDDSKRQIYLSSDLSPFNILRPRVVSHAPPVRTGASPTKKKLKAGGQRLFGILDFKWLLPDQPPEPASHAKLIYYPQYPEVRLSGFCLGVRSLPSHYFKEKAGETFTNRLLFLGVASSERTFGFLAVGHNLLAKPFIKAMGKKPKAALIAISMANSDFHSERRLIQSLRRIHQLGWIRGCRLTSEGLKENDAPNAVGYTLEAQLGIENNGRNAPDFDGYEIKAAAASADGSPFEKAITLMTPEPDLGVYKECGVVEFLKRWGYPDSIAGSNRQNFGGIYRFGQYHKATGLKLDLSGFDPAVPDYFEPNGCVRLVDRHEVLAAGWSFSKLVEVWSRKHSRAAYVSAERRGNPREFRYAAKVTLCEGTDFLKLLRLIASGDLYLDPGIKAENWQSPSPTVKTRNQFRTKHSQLHKLYDRTKERELGSRDSGN